MDGPQLFIWMVDHLDKMQYEHRERGHTKLSNPPFFITLRYPQLEA
jgi:hypothetical protein